MNRLARGIGKGFVLGAFTVGVAGGYYAFFSAASDEPSTPASTTTTTSTTVEPMEDDPAFDCEIHGNRVCGRVNVERWWIGDNEFIEIFDSRGRSVFGPVAISDVD